MERSELITYGMIVAIISMVVSPLWDMATTALVTDWVTVCTVNLNDPLFPLLAWLGMSRIEFWLKIWTFTFSGQTLTFMWVNVVSIIGAIFFILADMEYGITDKIIMFFITVFTWTGLCQITNSFEDWFGVFYRNTFGYDLLYWNYDIYGALGKSGMMPLGPTFWVPWWVYIVSRIGEGLLLIAIAFMILWIIYDRELDFELYSNIALLIVAISLTLIPVMYM